ncbi:UNVERIFIED_ORG: hypothetical protein FHR35_001759 [Microbispora rosea subsp. rosea]
MPSAHGTRGGGSLPLGYGLLSAMGLRTTPLHC